MVNKYKVFHSISQGGNEGGSSFERFRCAMCGKKHLDKCFVGMNLFFGCGKKGHKMIDCPSLNEKNLLSVCLRDCMGGCFPTH